MDLLNSVQFLTITCILSYGYMGVGAGKMELEGPSLLHYPDPVTYFSNSMGTLLSCLGKGHPPLVVSWLSLRGELLPQIPEIREILPNGSLSYGSFRFEEYNPDIHNSQLQCAVSNPLGTFLSPILTIRAVLDTSFELFITGIEDTSISATDMTVGDGNPLILKCNISSNSNFMNVIGWKSVDQFGYQTPIHSDGTRYQITSSGTLIIFSVKNHQQLYICVAQNSLNKKIQSSPPFLVKSSQAPPSGLPPRTSVKWEQIIQAELTKPLDLFCPASGNSPLQFRWEKVLGLNGANFKSRMPVSGNPGIGIYGPVLSFDRLDRFHNGSYRCEVSNSFGNLILDYHLSLSKELVLSVEPKRKYLSRSGSTVELTCRIISQHQSDSSIHKIDFSWYKNGKAITSSGLHIKLTANKLIILNTGLDDQGIYQCFGIYEGQSAMASSELMFEALPPELQQTFITQSLQPGPTVSLKCSATGNPLPDIKWFVDGSEFLDAWFPSIGSDLGERTNSRPYWQISDRFSVGNYRQHSEVVSHLNITNVRLEDSGLYSCKGLNLLGQVVHSARVNIYGPLFVKDMSSLVLVADESALIPCVYGGYPVDKITWNKNSRDLIESGSRFSILGNGTLRIEKINSDVDKGTYECTIANRKGESASGSVDVNIMYPPIISVFSFDDNLIEGQRTSITCNVISGDLPIEIKWFKDFALLPSILNVAEMRVKFLSYLIFEKLARDHSGLYTCSASNGAATTNHSALLSVKVPAYWVQEPQDANVILGSVHINPCVADGVPKPVVKWYRDSGMLKLPVQHDRRFEILEGGSLRIEDIQAMDSSNYICEAGNGLGIGLGKSIRLHVNIPAKVSASVTSLVVAEGLQTRLHCQIRGDPPIQVEWRKNGVVVVKTDDSPSSTRFQIIQNYPPSTLDINSTTSFLVYLQIDSIEIQDSGNFLCTASNNYGRDEVRITLEVKARPPAPEDFTVEEIGSRFIRLQWSPGQQSSTTGIVPITYFVLQFKKSGSSSWIEDVNNMTVQFPVTHAILEPLLPISNYDIRLLASNEIGHSLPTEPLAVLTLPEAPSGPPLNISALPISSKAVLVRWVPPNPSMQHGTILGYQITATLQPNNHHLRGGITPGSINTTTTITLDEKWREHTEVNGLRPNSHYRLSVRAYNTAGVGPDSPFVYVHTPEGVPDGPPQNIQCGSLTSPRSLHVQWDPPPHHLSNGQIQGYKLIYQSVQNENWGEKAEVKKTLNRETSLHGLQSFTNYSIRALAFTLGGEGILSSPLYCLTEEDVPEEPADLKVLLTSSTSVLLSWLPPLQANGIITKYTIYWKSNDTESIKEKSILSPSGTGFDLEDLNYEIRRLRETHIYSFWVTATTSAGTGRSSKIQSITLSSKISARIVSFPMIRNRVVDQSVMLHCKGIGIPSPKVTWLRNNRVDTGHHILRNGSLFIARIKEVDEGIWTCRVENGIGTDEIIHRIFLHRPPGSVSLFLGYVSSTNVQIHWEPPSQADPPVIGYLLQYHREKTQPTEGWEERRLTPRTTSYTVEPLRCGTIYTFRIAAENVIGLGPFSNPSLQSRTNGQKPETEPKLYQILDGNGTTVKIDLHNWPNGGCPLWPTFQIEYRLKKDGTAPHWQRIYRPDNLTRQFTFSTQPGFTYEIRITVENDAGEVTKFFEIEANSDFFSSYEKMMKEKDRLAEERSGGDSFLIDPHLLVVVPIVSSVICTVALILCVLIIRRKRGITRDEWKFSHSTSQQTWLSSEDGQLEPGKGSGNHLARGRDGIYATLNSAKPIPMEIRDSTVRFQTFGQCENYDGAPPIPTPNYNKKYRRKSGGPTSGSPTDVMSLETSCGTNQNDYGVPVAIDSRNYNRYYNSESDEDTDADSLYPDYARPYSGMRRADAKLPAVGVRQDGKNTLKRKQMAASRNRGIPREYLD